MTVPVNAVIADLRGGKGIANPGDVTVENIGYKNGQEVPDLVQVIPANPTGDPNAWTRLWYTDPNLGITRATLFRLWPGKTWFPSETYGTLPAVKPKDIKTRWCRVYLDSRADNPTAETLAPVGTLRRWCFATASRTGVSGSGADTEFLMAYEIWSNAVADWSVDTRIFKPDNALKTAAGRLDIG